MIIYIYGSKKFKKEVKSLLVASDILNDVEDINTIERLKTTIKEHPNDIFLIDHTKIIDNNSLICKVNFLKPKDGIDKEFLDRYGVGDICFNSMGGFIQYILNRLKDTPINNIESNLINEDKEEYEFNSNIDLDESDNLELQPRDLTNIISIDDIYEDEMVGVINDFNIEKK